MFPAVSDFHRVAEVTETVVTPGVSFLSGRTGALYRWWAGAGHGAPPPRARFDVAEHAAIATNLYLVERGRDGTFRFRVRGNEAIRLLGGKALFQDLLDYGGAVYGPLLRDYYRAVMEDGRCRRCTGTLRFWNKDFVRFESVDCPLADETGQVRFLIGAIDPVGSV